MKTPFALTLVLALNASAFGGDPDVVQQLRSDLLGKNVTLATDVAGYSCVYSATLDFPTRRLVDTEVNPDGETRYYLRAQRFMNVTQCPSPRGRMASMEGDYIDTRMISSMYAAGSSAVVKSIEAKPDRIEIQLQPEGAAAGDEAYAKIKLMLGKGYESRGVEKIETALAKGIRMPRIESIQESRSALDQVNQSIESMEQRLAASGDVETKISLAKALLESYGTQTEAEQRLNAVAFEKVPAQQNFARVAQLNKIINDGEQQIQAEKVARASAKYSSAALAARQACEAIPSTPARSLAELERTSGVIRNAHVALSQLAGAKQEMLALGQTIPEEDDQMVSSCGANAANTAASIEKQRTELMEAQTRAGEQQHRQQVADAIRNLRVDFNKMKQERAEFDAKLMSALGVQDESAVFSDYRAHLKRMVWNRQQALRLGDEAAQGEITSLENDLKKVR